MLFGMSTGDPSCLNLEPNDYHLDGKNLRLAVHISYDTKLIKLLHRR